MRSLSSVLFASTTSLVFACGVDSPDAQVEQLLDLDVDGDGICDVAPGPLDEPPQPPPHRPGQKAADVRLQIEVADGVSAPAAPKLALLLDSSAVEPRLREVVVTSATADGIASLPLAANSDAIARLQEETVAALGSPGDPAEFPVFAKIVAFDDRNGDGHVGIGTGGGGDAWEAAYGDLFLRHLSDPADPANEIVGLANLSIVYGRDYDGTGELGYRIARLEECCTEGANWGSCSLGGPPSSFDVTHDLTIEWALPPEDGR